MNKSLVSVVVITYNSSKTIIDTLDSIYCQTYPNIELIISDDCSNDNTVELCKKWLDCHNERFINTKILEQEKNQGTVKNLNRGIRASSGPWIKVFAGDDKLIPVAIKKYINFCDTNIHCRMCVADMELFCDDGEVPKSKIDAWTNFFKKSVVSQREQWKGIQKTLVFTGPSYFFSRSLYDEVGGYDENYVLMEEWPFCYEVLKLGYKIYAIPEKLIQYRVSPTSVCNSRKDGLRNKQLFKDDRRFFYKTRLLKLLSRGKIISVYCSILNYEIENLEQEKFKAYKVFAILLRVLNPSWWRSLFKNRN